MDYSTGESRVVTRFAEKCRLAGGPKAGYVLRRESILYGLDEPERRAAEEGIESLVARGLLAANEAGDRCILTEEGAAALDSQVA